MSRLEFRAWDKNGGNWADFRDINIEVAEGDGPSEVFILGDRSPAYVYMQYTGLKDSRGKKIYEGDIVEWLGDDGTPQYWAVVFEAAGFWVNGSGLWDYMDVSETHCPELAVVGNIYANPGEFGI